VAAPVARPVPHRAARADRTRTARLA